MIEERLKENTEALNGLIEILTKLNERGLNILEMGKAVGSETHEQPPDLVELGVEPTLELGVEPTLELGVEPKKSVKPATLNDIVAVATKLLASGKRDVLLRALEKVGVTKINMIPEDKLQQVYDELVNG